MALKLSSGGITRFESFRRSGGLAAMFFVLDSVPPLAEGGCSAFLTAIKPKREVCATNSQWSAGVRTSNSSLVTQLGRGGTLLAGFSPQSAPVADKHPGNWPGTNHFDHKAR